MPVDNEAPKIAQLYIVDLGDELNCRLNIFDQEGGNPGESDPFVVLALTDMLDVHNHYVQMCRGARERLQSAGAPNSIREGLVY